MRACYKQYTILYEEKDGKIIVSSITANGNFVCMYGTRTYDSFEDLKNDIDAGKYGCH